MSRWGDNVEKGILTYILFVDYKKEYLFQGHFCTFSHQKMAFFTSFCTAHFDIQGITLTFTFQNGGTS